MCCRRELPPLLHKPPSPVIFLKRSSPLQQQEVNMLFVRDRFHMESLTHVRVRPCSHFHAPKNLLRRSVNTAVLHSLHSVRDLQLLRVPLPEGCGSEINTLRALPPLPCMPTISSGSSRHVHIIYSTWASARQIIPTTFTSAFRSNCPLYESLWTRELHSQSSTQR